MSDAGMVVHEPAPGVGLGVHPGYPSWPHIVTPLPNVSLLDSIGADLGSRRSEARNRVFGDGDDVVRGEGSRRVRSTVFL